MTATARSGLSWQPRSTRSLSGWECGLSRSLAPGFFSRHDETGYSFVHRQPVKPDEIEQAEEALIGCPTESIGCDGAPVASAAGMKP